MLVIKDLTKTYSSGVTALKGVNLELSPGVFGLLGPNGSGKTTLMKIVATLLEPDSGTIEMNGADLITRKDHTRRMLGYLPQDFGLYPTLTAWLYNPLLYQLWKYHDLTSGRVLGYRLYCLALAAVCLALAHVFFARKS